MKKCPYCAGELEDTTMMCHHCGKSLISKTISISSLPEDETQAFGKLCVICHAEKIRFKQEGVFSGLLEFAKEISRFHFPTENISSFIKRNIIICDQCGVVFRQHGTKWKLAKINDEDNSIWLKYGQRELLAKEWANIEQRIVDDERREAEISSCKEKISSGALKVKVIRAQVPVILHKDEEALCVLPSIYLNETRAVRVSGGGYGGVSYRVTKHASVHLGQFGARSESHPEMRQIDEGTLVITNKRFIYCGAIKTVDISLNKVVQIDPFDDGIALHKEDREKNQYFTWTNHEDLERAISQGSRFLANRIVERNKKMGYTNGEIEVEDQGKKNAIPLTGEILKSIIEGAVKNT